MSEAPSILIRNIFHMLCYAYKILRQKNYAPILKEDFKHVDDLLAAILVRGVAKQVKQGLWKTYIPQHEIQKTLQGKLNPYPTKRLRVMKMRMVDCSYDELSADNEMNQILKATANLLLQCKEVDAKQKNDLRKLMLFFTDISVIDLSCVQWSRLQFERNNRCYEMLMNICHMVYMSQLPSTTQGRTKFSLFDEESLPWLYEKFILQYYCQHYPGLHASDKSISWDIPEDVNQENIRMLPGMHSDITLNDGRKTLIIDAKFYRHATATYKEKNMLHSANLYQIYTYVKNCDKKQEHNVAGMLLYAHTTEPISPFLSVPIGGNQITVQTLDLNRPFSEIADSLDQIASAYFGDEVSRVA